jgi:hypothetical protein
MIRRICLAAMAAVAAVGCCEKECELIQFTEGGDLVTFSVSVPEPETKSVGPADEKTVNSLQVFAFNRNGIYEASAYGDKTQMVELTCTAGEKIIVALVNAEKEENVADYDDLAGRTVYLKDSGVGDLVMVGETDVTVAAGNSVTVDVSYISSKVVLESVTLNLENQLHHDLDFAVTSVFLTNVAGDRKYISDSTPQTWYHEGRFEEDNTLPFLRDIVEEGDIETGGKQYEVEHYFYCYPNSAADKKTRLVIETMIEGQLYYYPIELDKVLPNNQYSYSVVLTRLGIDSPDGSLEKGACGVTVSMKDWVTNSSVVEI